MKELQFHNEYRHATWLELFLDLVFVASVGVIAHNLAHTHHGHIDLRQILMFPVELLPIWWIWASHTLYANRFDTDSRWHRFASLSIMFLMVTMAAFLGDGLFEHYQRFLGFYIAIRLILAALYFSSSRKLDDSANFAKITGTRLVVGAVICATSIFFDSPVREVILVAGILLEMIAAVVISIRINADPIHRPHFVERIGLLSIILLGESVISLVAGLRGVEWNALSMAAAMSGFLFIGLIWWIFFDSFHTVERMKNMKRGYTLLYSNIFFAMGLVVLANLIRHAILNDLNMHDFQILAIAGLTSFYIGKQTNYYRFFPPYRPYIWINSVACVGITVASTFLSRPEYALMGMTFGMLVYVTLNYIWALKIDISDYLDQQ